MTSAPTPDELRQLLATIRAFGAACSEGLQRRDHGREFSRALWRRCAELGLLGLAAAPEHGGSGFDLQTTVAAMIELGEACRDNGLVFALGAHMFAFQLPIQRFGTADQRARWLAPAVAGALIGAHAITEPDHGSDALSLTTTARRDGEGYVLDGAKAFVTNAPVADAVLVFATVDRAWKAAGVTAFVVERGTPGMTLSRPVEMLGLRTAPLGEVALADCRVPASARLGREGEGAAVFHAAMSWERTAIFAGRLGAMKRLLADTITYARTRKQFDQPIAKFSPVADRIVDMKVAIDAGELLVRRAAAAADAGEDATLPSAIAKLFVSEAHVEQVLAALQIHGAHGHAVESQVERELRDALPGTLYSGTSEIQRRIIARMLGL